MLEAELRLIEVASLRDTRSVVVQSPWERDLIAALRTRLRPAAAL
jgi:hypothetical protein